MTILTGDVIEKLVGVGSKNEYNAACLRTEGQGDFVLRRVGGPVFDDEDIKALVGHRISGEGVLTGNVFIMTMWEILG